MADGLTIAEVENYVNVVIPKIEKQLSIRNQPTKDKRDAYLLYLDILRLVAPYNFQSFNKFIEIDEDHNLPTKAFYHNRKNHMGELFDALNDMEIYDEYDYLIITMSPRTGKTSAGIRFLSWIMGRHPESPQLATSYSDNITSSFYIGVMEVVQHERFKEVFPEAVVVNQNAKREEIWLKTLKRYPSISFVPIGGSMTGRCEAEKYLYCDDLVSGLEEALSIVRLKKLCDLYSVNCKQRKKEGAREIHIATHWSVHDVLSKVKNDNENNPRCKVISIPCYDENGESNFNFNGGFSTKYYKDMENSMDSASFSALYKCEPIEREGLLYNKDELQFYFELPSEAPDSIIGICDSKNMGKDYVSALTGYVYGDFVYIDDVVYNNGLPEITKILVANMWLRHKVVRADIEMNNGGNYYGEGVDTLIKEGNGKTSIRTFFTGNNKVVKIVTYSDFAKKQFIFKDASMYNSNSEYAMFMKDLCSWTQTGKNPHDDAPDSTAMLAQLMQDLSGNSVKVLKRKQLGI